MTIAEWLGLAAMLAAPYVVIGVVWAVTHAENRSPLQLLAAVVTWPALLISDLCVLR